MKQLFILFLLISTVSATDFNVTWTPIKEDIVNKEYRITIQNLDTDMQTVDIDSFFEDTNFDTSKIQDVEFYEQSPKNKMMILDKKQSKTLKTNKKMKEVLHGKITLPSVKTKGKINNAGTKTFILKFKTPPIGSHGKVGLKINGKKYHPYWNSTWSNRKKITLTGNTSGSQTDYQLLLNITYEAEMNSDFSDVRFCNDTDQLSAWLESKINESYALIWVKFPHTPTDGETEDYWMYYGNSGADAYWNGNTTFEFFDDAEFGIYGDKWINIIGSGEYSTDESYQGSKSIKFSSTTDQTSVSKNINIDDAVFEAMVKNVGSDNYYTMVTARASQSAKTYYGYRANYNNNGQLYKRISGSWTSLDTDVSSDDVSEWHKWSIICYGSSIKTYFDDELRNEATDSSISSGGIGTRGAVSNNQYYDNVRIRKYVSSEPTYTFGDIGYYVDSIYFNSSNPYYNLIDYKGNIAVNHSYSPSDNLEWTAQAVDDDTGLVVTSMGSSEIDFTTYEGILDWLQLVDLDNSKIYILQNSSGNIEEHQASGNAVNFTTDLSPDDYEIQITDGVPPTPTPEPSPTTLHNIKMSDNAIKSFYYPFMYILFIVIIIGGFMHVFGN